jgi:hypothetical protein
MQTDSANGGNAIGDQAMSADGLFYLGKERSMPPSSRNGWDTVKA